MCYCSVAAITSHYNIVMNIAVGMFASLTLLIYAYISVFVAFIVFICIYLSILTLTLDSQTAKVTYSS